MEYLFTQWQNKQTIDTHLTITDPWVRWNKDIDGLVQDCSNSSALAMELLQFSAESSISSSQKPKYDISILCVTQAYHQI